jgi:hypothetical protein
VSGNVPVAQATSDEAALPEPVQEAVGQLMVAIADLAWLKPAHVAARLAPSAKCEPSSGGTGRADDAPHRKLRGRAAVAAARQGWARGGGVSRLRRRCRERER